jgi:hypothetical protein
MLRACESAIGRSGCGQTPYMTRALMADDAFEEAGVSNTRQRKGIAASLVFRKMMVAESDRGVERNMPGVLPVLADCWD